MIVFFLIALEIVAVSVLIYEEPRGGKFQTIAAKTVSSLIFFATALLCGVEQNPTDNMLVYGLLCGVIGDVLLGLNSVKRPDDNCLFFIGTLAFAIGHIFYLITFCESSGELLLPFIIGAVVTAIVAYILQHRISSSGIIKAFGSLYLLFVIEMASLAVYNALHIHSLLYFLRGIGATLFAASDILLVLI